MQVNLPTLWPHQETFVAALRTSLAKHRASIACGVTGFGKSRIAKWIMAKSYNGPEFKEGKSGRYLFCVHRRGLVDNIHGVFDEEPRLPHGVIMAGTETSRGYRVQVGSIDTILSWWCEDGQYQGQLTFDMIVFDECHSHLGKLKTFLDCHQRERTELGLTQPCVIGLSATPECKGLADVFGDIVTGPPPTRLQDEGYAAKFRYLSGKKGRLELLEKASTGEFTSQSVHKAMDGLAGDFVRDWRQHAKDRPTIGFFPRLSHAREAQRMLNTAGIRAEYVDGDTPDDERRQLFLGLQVGDYPYLCNVGVVERGTDIPAASCIQLCTSIGSRVRYLQMIGRGARVHESKDHTLVLDHGGNVGRHGFWEDEIPWTLDRSVKASKDHAARPTVECPQCQAIYRGGECRSCGYRPTPLERRSQGLKFNGSELSEYSTTKPRTAKKSAEEAFIGHLYMGHHKNMTWKQVCAIHGRAGYRVPRRFTVGDTSYEAIPFGHTDGGRRVTHLFPFLTRKG